MSEFDKKISALTSGTDSTATDEYVIARGGSNFKISGALVAAAATKVGTLASLTVSGTASIATGIASQLAVFGANNTTDKYLTLKNSDGDLYLGTSATSSYLWNVANTPLQFYTNNAVKMTLDASGNVGIGVTPSAWPGQAAGYDVLQVGPMAMVNTADTSGEITYNAFIDSSGVRKYILTDGATRYQQSAGLHAWFTAPSGTAGNTITFTPAMKLDASGNLLVGATTNTEGARLKVNDGYAFIKESGGADVYLRSAYAGGIAAIQVASNSALAFATNNTERARITAEGGMVVGTAALATSATDGFLYVPTCAGTPTGTPTTQTGTAPIIVDTTNNKLYFYSNAAWRDAGP